MGLFRATVRTAFPIGSGGGTNTWHLRTISDDGTTTEINGLMDLVEAFYVDVQQHFPTTTTWTWDGSVSQVGTTSPGLLGTGTPWTVQGMVSGSVYSGAPSMACVTWRSALATRRGRGRTFLGPLAAVSVQADGTLATGAVDAFRLAASELVSASLTDTNGAIVVWSELDQVGRDIVGATVTDQVAVLRSRR